MSSRKFINEGDYQLVLDNGRLVVRRPDATASTGAISFEYTNTVSPGYLGVDQGVLKYGSPIYPGSTGNSVPFDVYHEGRPPRIDEVDIADQPAAVNVYYVAENGADSNSGRTLSEPLRTIRAASLRADRLQAETMSFTIIDGQTEADYSNQEQLRGRGSVVDAGSGYSGGDVITLTTGAEITVDAVDGSGAVTEFTVSDVSNASTVIPGWVYAQESTDGAGTGFKIKIGIENVTAGNPVRPPVSIFVKAGTYTENNPTVINRKVAVWGDTLRSVFVSPRTKTIAMSARTQGISHSASAGIAGNLATNRNTIISSVLQDLRDDIYSEVLTEELENRYTRDMNRFITALIEDFESGEIDRVAVVAMDYYRQVSTVYPQERELDPQGSPSPTTYMLQRFSVRCEASAAGSQTLAEVFEDTLDTPQVEIQQLVASQTEADYDDTGDNGTFSGGAGYTSSDVITLSNGDTITVDAVDGSGAVTEFTVTTVTGTAVSGNPLSQSSVAPTGGTGFDLTPQSNNLEFIVESVRPAQISVTVSGGEITSVAVDNAGYGYRQIPEPPASMQLVDTAFNPGGYDDAARLLRLNRDYVKQRVIEYVNWKLDTESPTDPDWAGLTLTPAQRELCKRDTGYILDAIIQDLQFGGNIYSVDSAVTYRDNGSVLPPDQRQPTVDTFAQIVTLAEGIVRQTEPDPLYTGQSMSGFVTSGSASVADPDAVDSIVSGLIDGINNTITDTDPVYRLTVVGVLDERPENTISTRAGVLRFDIVDHQLALPSTPADAILDAGENLTDGTYDVSADIPHPDDSYDLFYVNTGCYFSGMTFNNLSGEASAVAYDPLRRDPLTPAAIRGHITTSPYVQNCSTINLDQEGGLGMKINGKHARVLRSMVCDSFTQINTAGTGVHLLNRGYAQLVSIFTVSTNVGIRADTGGLCSVANSNSSFGNYGLVSRGVSEELDSGTVNSGDISQFDTVFTVTGLGRRPAFGDALLFDLLYPGADQGSDVYLFDNGLSLRTTVADENNVEIIDDDGVIPRYRYEILNRAPFEVRFLDSFAPSGSVNARLRKYYTVNESTDLSSTQSTVTLDLGITESVIPDTTTVRFYQRSLITTSSHTFEYVGGGTNFLTAIPAAGGVPIRVNEIIQDSDLGGSVFFTSTDDRGDFRIGPELTINRNTGTITGEAFERSLFGILTPYILALET